MQLGVFEALALIMFLAAVVGIIFKKINQPLIIAFIVAGILAGPYGLKLVDASNQKIIFILAEFGISILLFIVGLKMDFKEIRSSGKAAALVGLGKMAVVFVVGLGVALLFGKPTVDALYIGLCIVFSSTIIVIKLLSDKRETESLFGRIAIGALIIEDIVAIITIVVINSLGAAAQGSNGNAALIKMIVGGIAATALIFLLSSKVFPWLLRSLAKITELFVLFVVAWSIGIAALFYWLGLSVELGAFIAGVALASSPFRKTMMMRLATLRDFLLLFFFINLGAGLELKAALGQLPIALVLSVVVLVFVPLTAVFFMGLLGYRRHTSYLTGVVLGQISELSLILVALGVSMGHISLNTQGVVTMVAILSIAASTYSMRYAQQTYNLLEKALKIFPVRREHKKEDSDDEGFRPAEFIIFGLGRYGTKIAAVLEGEKHVVLGIDFDPSITRKTSTEYLHYSYGDIEDVHLAEHLPLAAPRWVICTTPFADKSVELLRSLRLAGYAGKFAGTVHRSGDRELLEKGGVDLVLTPFIDAAQLAVDRLLDRTQATLALPDDEDLYDQED